MNQRRKLLRIAARLMSKRGYSDVSLQNIADRAGIHKSTLFHYFKRKEQILLQIIDVAYERLVTNMDRVLKEKGMVPEEKLKIAVTSHIVILVEYIDNVNVLNNEMRHISREHRNKYNEIRKQYETHFVRIIDQIKKTNSRSFRGLDSKIIVYGILAMCNGVAKWYKKESKMRPEEIGDIFFRMIKQN
jgi:TetR/AcrR family transcriptional regulator, cholesterol catabolism regulator